MNETKKNNCKLKYNMRNNLFYSVLSYAPLVFLRDVMMEIKKKKRFRFLLLYREKYTALM